MLKSQTQLPRNGGMQGFGLWCLHPSAHPDLVLPWVGSCQPGLESLMSLWNVLAWSAQFAFWFGMMFPGLWHSCSLIKCLRPVRGSVRIFFELFAIFPLSGFAASWADTLTAVTPWWSLLKHILISLKEFNFFFSLDYFEKQLCHCAEVERDVVIHIGGSYAQQQIRGITSYLT